MGFKGADYKKNLKAPWSAGTSGNPRGSAKFADELAAVKSDLTAVVRQINRFANQINKKIAELAANQAEFMRDFYSSRTGRQEVPPEAQDSLVGGEEVQASPPKLQEPENAPEATQEPTDEPPPPEPKTLTPRELVSNLGYTPRIVGEDSHTCIIGPDGKVSYIPKNPQPAQQCAVTVCEAANASDPRKHRR